MNHQDGLEAMQDKNHGLGLTSIDKDRRISCVMLRGETRPIFISLDLDEAINYARGIAYEIDPNCIGQNLSFRHDGDSLEPFIWITYASNSQLVELRDVNISRYRIRRQAD